MTYQKTCLCKNTISLDGPMPQVVASSPREIKEAQKQGWVRGCPDPVLRPDEYQVYCSHECRKLDAAQVDLYRPSNYRWFIEISDLDPDRLSDARRAAEGMDPKDRERQFLLHYIGWLEEHPEENERGRAQDRETMEERRGELRSAGSSRGQIDSTALATSCARRSAPEDERRIIPVRPNNGGEFEVEEILS